MKLRLADVYGDRQRVGLGAFAKFYRSTIRALCVFLSLLTNDGMNAY